MLLTIGADSTSVTIKPWLDAQITDLGKSTYDKTRQSFTDADGKTFDIEEKITNLDAPVIDTEE